MAQRMRATELGVESEQRSPEAIASLPLGQLAGVEK